METITTPKTNFGFFGWRAVAEVSKKVLIYLAGLGLLQLLQRSPATSAEKKLAGYEKRPSGFNRSEIPFNDENQGIFTKIMSQVLDLEDVGEALTPVIECWYHDLGATKEPAYADEKKIVQRHIDAKDIVTWAVDKVGYHGDGELDTENVEFLRAVKAYKAAMLANA
jgi:hypothetical protein